MKEKKDDKEKDDKEDEKNDHVQFEDTPQILAEPVVQVIKQFYSNNFRYVRHEKQVSKTSDSISRLPIVV